MQSNLLISKFILHDQLQTRFPFLRKNLQQISDSAEGRRSVTRKKQRLHREDFDPRELHHFLHLRMTQQITPELHVSIGDIISSSRNANSPAAAMQSRSRMGTLDMRCTLRAKIYGSRRKDEELFQTHRIVHLQGGKLADGKWALSIKLTEREQPFVFRMDELEDIIEKEDGNWRIGMGKRYTMLFELGFRSQLDAKAVGSALDLPVHSPSFALKAKWTSLPTMPEQEQLLPLFGERAEDTCRYSLKIKMAWGTEHWVPRSGNKRQRVSTPLETQQAIQKRQINGQLPTPASTPRSEGSASSVSAAPITVTYHLNNTKVEKNGFKCIICTARSEQRSLAALEWHFKQYHVGVVFEIQTDLIDSSTVNIIIKDIPEERGKRNRNRPEQSDKAGRGIQPIDWQRPKKPFNLKNVAAGGEQHWTLSKTKTIASDAKSSAPRVARPLPARDIKLELPILAKRSWPVIKHQTAGAEFFSADNKSVLRTGEVVEDEDDNISNEHKFVAQRSEIQDFNLSGTEMKFLCDINEHITEEQVQADVYLGPCLRRWIHKRADWLKDEDMAKHYETYINGALKFKLVTEETHRACMQALKVGRERQMAASAEAGTHRGGQKESDSEKGGIRRRGHCVCNKPVEGRKDTLICNGDDCEYPAHHLSCVTATSKAKDPPDPWTWVCQSCRRKTRMEA